MEQTENQVDVDQAAREQHAANEVMHGTVSIVVALVAAGRVMNPEDTAKAIATIKKALAS